MASRSRAAPSPPSKSWTRIVLTWERVEARCPNTGPNPATRSKSRAIARTGVFMGRKQVTGIDPRGSEFKMDPQRGYNGGTAGPVEAGVEDALHIGSGEDAVPDVGGVVGLKEI